MTENQRRKLAERENYKQQIAIFLTCMLFVFITGYINLCSGNG